MSVAKSYWTERMIMGQPYYTRFAALRPGVSSLKQLRKGDLYATLSLDMDAPHPAEYVVMIDADLERMLINAMRQVDPARLEALRARLRELDEEREDVLMHLAKIEHVQKYGGEP